MPRTVAVTGATGLLGTALVPALLARGDRVIALVRDPSRAPAGAEARRWDASDRSAPLAGADAVVHLAGVPVAEGRWTASRKRLIEESRVAGTRSVVEGLREAGVKLLVSASGVDAYGDTGDAEVDEGTARAPASAGFLPAVCEAWEREAERAREAGARVVLLRTGMVLARQGGALGKLLPPFRLGVGGPVGRGRQWVPWIHLDDAVGLVLHALDVEAIDGPLDVVGPAPVTSRDFARALGRAVGRPAILPSPAPVLRVVFGQVAEAILASHRVLPRRALETGYRFRFEALEAALADVVP